VSGSEEYITAMGRWSESGIDLGLEGEVSVATADGGVV
jgi:hypothetical protein